MNAKLKQSLECTTLFFSFKFVIRTSFFILALLDSKSGKNNNFVNENKLSASIKNANLLSNRVKIFYFALFLYLAPLPNKTILMVLKITIKSRIRDIFLI